MSPSPATLIAIDLGASSGRVIVGTLADGRLSLGEVHRFEHAPRMSGGALRWDWRAIREGVRAGLDAVATEGAIAGVSCDSWAQDFGLLDAHGRLLAEPVSYRDGRTAGMPQSFADIIAPDDLVRRVGSTAAPIIALCQLRALAQREPDTLARASRLLHLADLIHHELCGAQCTDRTMATASGLRSLATGAWDVELVDALGIPPHILPEAVEEERVIGEAQNGALAGVPVIAGAGHDTAAASVLCTDDRHAFLSCGTWSMLGCLSDEPIVPAQPARDGLAILGMVGGRWSLMRSLMGLWPLQQCMARWRREGLVAGWAEVIAAAAGEPVCAVIDLDDPRLSAPGDMPRAIAECCRATRQPVPGSPAAMAAMLLHSLALEHGLGVETLERVTGRRFDAIRMVGGGSANALLCRLSADATGRPVIAGPTEATAAGNLLTQARALGLSAADDIPAITERSFRTVCYEPEGALDATLTERHRDLKGARQ
ncbi:MAG: rhamnulokinase family protein [Armatimonadota bacterium]